MIDILVSQGCGDSTALYDASCSPGLKMFWDRAYGYTTSAADFQEILDNLKRFATFLGDIT
jgi:hypothetical protein